MNAVTKSAIFLIVRETERSRWLKLNERGRERSRGGIYIDSPLIKQITQKFVLDWEAWSGVN